MADFANIYQPLIAPQQPAMTPLGILQLIGQLNENKLFNQTYQARQAIGQAYSNNVLPNGEINTPGLRSQIGQTGGFLAGEGLQQATANSAQDLALKSSYVQTMRNIFGDLSTLPVITDVDIAKRKQQAAAAGVPAAVIQDYTSQIPNYESKAGQSAAKDWAVTQSNVAQGPGVYSKGVTIPGVGGTPTQITEGLAARARAQGGLPVGLAPGQETQISEPKQTFLADQEKSAQTQANLRQLNTVYPLVQELGNSNFGPGSAEFAKIKGALITAGVIDPNTSDLQVRQEVGKYLLRYAQGAQNAGRSDHALSTAIGSNPNLDLTKPANLKLIRNQIGMDRADAAIPILFDQLYPSDADKSQYKNFKDNFYNKNYDQRVFTYDLMSPQERRQVIDSLGKPGSPAFKKFDMTYNEAKHAGFIVPQNAQ